MPYTINQLARLAGISTRTLRHYEAEGLLSPVRTQSNGYRVYGQAEVERLQQILFYRELDIPLSEIRRALTADHYDRAAALQSHLSAMRSKRDRLDDLIINLEQTLRTIKGETPMSDEERFKGFVNKMIDDNEKHYGDEVRQKHGNDALDRSNAKMRGWSQQQYDDAQRLAENILALIKSGVETGDLDHEAARKVCTLHRQWLCLYWDHYSPEAHRSLAEAYVDDPRFKAYYEAAAPGGAVFLRDAIRRFCQ